MVQLRDLPGFLDGIKKASVGTVRAFHLLTYGEEGDRRNRERLRKFDGFPFGEDSEEFAEKLTLISTSIELVELAAICFMMNISYEGTKEDVALRILKVLIDLEEFMQVGEGVEDNEDDEEHDAEANEDYGEAVEEERRTFRTQQVDDLANVNGQGSSSGRIDHRQHKGHSQLEQTRQQRSRQNFDETNEMTNRFTMTFRDVQESIRNFTGEDNYTIEAWLNDFEEIADIMKWKPLEKLVCARRCICGLARTFLQSERGLTTWQKFKSSMLAEFSRRVTSAELHADLSNRIMKKHETYQQYYFTMKEIASRGQVEEEALINYIVDGIQDSTTNKLTLYEAASLKDLKSKLQVYEKVRRKFDNGSKWSGLQQLSENVTYSKEKFQRKQGMDGSSGSKKDETMDGGSGSKNGTVGVRDAVTTKLRCYNCNGLGHVAAACRKPKREPGSCFNCGDRNHRISECPIRQNYKKVTSGKLPSAVSANSGNQISVLSNLPPYMINVIINFNQRGTSTSLKLEAMLDSGSPISIIKQSCMANISFEEVNVPHNYTGLNQSRVNILGISKCEIIIDNITVPINLYVVPDTTMGYSLILGRDFFNFEDLQITFINNQARIIKSNNDEFLKEIMMIEPSTVETEQTLLINPNLDSEIQNSISNTIDAFLKADKPAFPETYFEAEIKLEPNHKPFSFGCRRVPINDLNKLREIINNLLADGILRESNSPYASPIVLVKKKTGDLRLCVDFRCLNKYTIRDRYPLPLISEQLDKLRGTKYFTKLDLRNAFHQVKLSNSSTKYTSFISPLGQFEYTRLPFGWCNSPSVFTRFLNQILRDLIYNGKICLYLDDILIATETIEENLETLEKILEIMNKNLLQLRLDKCVFLMTSITYLGYNVDEFGISPCKEHVEAVTKYPIPKTVRELQSFIGLISYFRKFVKDFSIKAKPLNDLLRKGATFDFGENHIKVFNMLKESLVSAPILAVYNPLAETQLHCDASSHGFGSVLMQKQEDYKFHPIAFFSKRTSPAEEKYHSFELECLSIIYALKRFHVYLSGIDFTILTDCNSLKLTLDKRDINPRISRWALFLQNYNYKLEHRAGNRMLHVDALSRNHNVLLLEENSFEMNLMLQQMQDKSILELKNRLLESNLKKYELRNGVVYRKIDDKILFVVPENMEKQVIQLYHDNYGHMGVDKCFELITRTYWFPAMREKILTHIQSCLKCIIYNNPSGKKEGEMHIIPKGDKPFLHLHIDHYGPLEKTGKGFRYIFEVIDGFSKYVKFYPCKTTNTQEVVNCLKKYFSNYSKPLKVISDRGSAFTSNVFKDFLKENDIEFSLIATGTPRANGQIERTNRDLTPLLSKLTSETKKWDLVLPEAEFVLNNTYNRSIGNTPSRILFGVDQRGNVSDNLRHFLENEFETNNRDLVTMRNEASEKIKVCGVNNKKNFDQRHKKPKEYSVGDFVVIKNIDVTPGVNKKLIPKYRGPYFIEKCLDNDRYVLKDIEGFQITQTPFKGIFEAGRIKKWLLCSDTKNL